MAMRPVCTSAFMRVSPARRAMASATWPIHRTSALLPMPSTPMNSMPTTMSA
jgi:hypothetical protein